MMKYYSLMVLFFVVCFSQTMEKKSLAELSPDESLQPINEKDLPFLLGTKVNVKINETGYITGFLGKKASDSLPYYQVYYDKERTKGNPYLPEQLYYMQSNDQ